jgi:hypothetical protein
MQLGREHVLPKRATVSFVWSSSASGLGVAGAGLGGVVFGGMDSVGCAVQNDCG